MINLKGQNDQNGFYKMGLIDWVQIAIAITIVLGFSFLVVVS